MDIVLASASPRRREILEGFGVSFRVVTADTDESCDLTDPCALTETLALRKARAVRRLLEEKGEFSPETLILAGDTVVSCQGQILGKPHGKADAERMLRLLSGSCHEVVSSVALIGGSGLCSPAKSEAVSHEVTKVFFDPIPESGLASYLDSEEPYDKAGAYAIQGTAAIWIRGIEGDFFNVVGLPAHLLFGMVRERIGKELTAE